MAPFIQKHAVALVSGTVVALTLISGGYFLNKKLTTYHPEYAASVKHASLAMRSPLASPLYPSAEQIQTYAERGTQLAVSVRAYVDYNQGPAVSVTMVERKNCRGAGTDPITLTALSNAEYHDRPLESTQTWCLDPTKLDQLEVVRPNGRWTDGKDKFDMASIVKHVVVKGKAQTSPVYLTGMAIEPCVSQTECTATVKVGYHTDMTADAPVYIEDKLIELQYHMPLIKPVIVPLSHSGV